MSPVRFIALIVSIFCLSACASSPMIQPQINSLVVAEKSDYAAKLLTKHQQSYGNNNQLLLLLDYGLVLHLAGRYQESFHAFERAKKIYNQLYTVSLSKEAATWLVNDYMAPYRGEDFERVMINIFQALNFAVMGNIEEALVEARDVDDVLSLINRNYKTGQKNVYKEDAFARLLMGILYEAGQTPRDFNDAYISYVKSLEMYEKDYAPHYKIPVPKILKENILAAAQFMGMEEFRTYQNRWQGVSYFSLQEKKERAEVCLIHYHGFSPIKRETWIPIPLPDGFVVKLVFPRYDQRPYNPPLGTLKAVDSFQKSWEEKTEFVEDITAIALQNLENRKVRVIAKAVLRQGGKYAFERAQEKNVRKNYGDTAADVFKVFSNLYNLGTERADLRSWQTLPSEIRIARLILAPGTYEIFFNEKKLGRFEIMAGEKRFFVMRTND